ncbi:MAG: hypothetical protein ACETWK_00700 [Candidatus Aminicenantaceae bacterium]
MKKHFLALLVIIFLIGNFFIHPQSEKVIRVSLPDKSPVELTPYAKLDFPLITESSGLVKSRLWPDVFWTHNDHGNEARIFPVRRDGSIIKAKWGEDYSGVLVVDGVNIDWEDIATDNDGNLIIGAFGNNSSTRRDLAFYIIREPYPLYTLITRISKKIQFYYPDQDGFPPSKENFDAEACFWSRGKIYILSKHRSDTFTTLYRLDSMDPFDLNPLTILGTFDSKGMVTGADATPDGNRLAVLTFNSVWLFEVSDSSDDYFNGKISWLPIIAKQCEGICFDGNTLIISNEQRDLFELPLDNLIVVKE